MCFRSISWEMMAVQSQHELLTSPAPPLRLSQHLRTFFSWAALCHWKKQPALLCVQECTPFAVIGSNTVVEARGQRVRGRLYPWGIVEGMWTGLNTNGFQHQQPGILLNKQLFLLSGKSVALWLCKTEKHADSFSYARPQRCDLRRALWKLQSAVHPGDDQVRECERRSVRTRSFLFSKHLGCLCLQNVTQRTSFSFFPTSFLQQTGARQPDGESHPHPAAVHSRRGNWKAHKNERRGGMAHRLSPSSVFLCWAPIIKRLE